jgi:hypothetical protein
MPDPTQQVDPVQSASADLAKYRAAKQDLADYRRNTVARESARLYAAAPTTDEELGGQNEPGVLSRAGSNIAGFIKQAATHPIDTGAALASAPFKSLNTAMAPGSEQDVADLNRIGATGKSGRRGQLPYRSTDIVTPGQRAAGVAQTVTNLVAPELARTGLGGLVAAGGLSGAAYNPDDPAAGAVTGAVLAPTAKAIGGGASKVASVIKNAPPGAWADLATSFVPQRPLAAMKRFTKASNAAADATPAPVADASSGALHPAEVQELIKKGFTPEAIAKVSQAKAAQAGGQGVTSFVKQAPSAGVSDALTPEAKAAWQQKAIETLMPHRPVQLGPDVAEPPLGDLSGRPFRDNQSHRTIAQFAQDAERLGVHGGVENTPNPPASVTALIKKAGGKLPASALPDGQWGDAEEAQGLAPYQQPDIAAQYAQTLAGLGNRRSFTPPPR